MALRAVGIDFGTTNTAAAVLDGEGRVRLVDLDGGPLMKSLIYFPSRREAFFGKEAIDRYFDRDMEGRFLQSIKRLLPNPEFQGTVIHGQHQSLEELVARFLKETLRRIEAQVGSIGGVPLVMGRPARYSLDDDREKLATQRFLRACNLAGLGNLELMEEPVAAAHTYEATAGREETVLIADLGGGTSDFTLLHLSPKGKRALATHGVPVAGDTIDSTFVLERLVRFFGSEIRYQRPFSTNILTLPTSFVKLLPKWHHHAFLKEKSTWNFLKTLHQELVDRADKVYLDNLITLVEDNLGYALHQKVEALKCVLSSEARADFAFRSHPIRIEFGVDRGSFDQMMAPSIQAIAGAAAETLRRAQVAPVSLSALYFTGGTSKVPAIRAAIQALVPGARVAEKDTFTSVAAGLALSRA